MLSFLKINAPDRLLYMFIIVMMIRLPLLFTELPLYSAELEGFIIGTKLSEGSLLYRDVWHPMAPLTALFFLLMSTIAENSSMLLHIAALVLLFWQGNHFGFTAINQELYPDKNFIPGFTFILLQGIHPSFLTISPMLLANTFLLITLRMVFRHIRVGIKDDEMLVLGATIGAAALCQLSTIVFIIVPLLAFVLYTGTNLKQYFLVTIGVIIPLLICLIIFFLFNALPDFYHNFLATLLLKVPETNLDYAFLVTVFSLPILLALAGFVSANSSRKLINYQLRLVAVIFIFTVAAVASLLLSNTKTESNYIIFTIPIAYAVSHFWQADIKPLWLSLIHLSLIAFCAFMPWLSINELISTSSNSSIIKKNDLGLPDIKKEKLLVVGYNYAAYYNNIPATPYLDRTLSERHFNNLNRYDILLDICRNFSQDKPKYILNDDNTLDTLFKRIPWLAMQYERDPNYRKIWKRRGTN